MSVVCTCAVCHGHYSVAASTANLVCPHCGTSTRHHGNHWAFGQTTEELPAAVEQLTLEEPPDAAA